MLNIVMQAKSAYTQKYVTKVSQMSLKFDAKKVLRSRDLSQFFDSVSKWAK